MDRYESFFLSSLDIIDKRSSINLILFDFERRIVIAFGLITLDTIDYSIAIV